MLHRICTKWGYPLRGWGSCCKFIFLPLHLLYNAFCSTQKYYIIQYFSQEIKLKKKNTVIKKSGQGSERKNAIVIQENCCIVRTLINKFTISLNHTQLYPSSFIRLYNTKTIQYKHNLFTCIGLLFIKVYLFYFRARCFHHLTMGRRERSGIINRT